MSTTTDDIKSGVKGLKVHDAQQAPADAKPNAKSQVQGDEFKVPAGPTVQHAENYDEAPPGVPGPDHSARDALRQQVKPVFNRGPSMLDFTAVTSAGPTPAGELPHAGSYFDGSRRRESHLPDDDEDVEMMRRQTVTETDTELPRRVPGDEVRGSDAFAPSVSRRETESGVHDATSGWTGASDTFGSHA
ncbi:hypothetical protein N8I77_003438 [Diaporthe amygdali]|uniref:Uncharacterized protein n=1 Tax=Phomopsis amygdali TaxID=1214568 RepID=A0AAD9SKD6_PHOAM|nr:hypothetical protein N8I77_003438 [Diaporthe amygdali]